MNGSIITAWHLVSSAPTEQVTLHDFFEPSKALTANELKAHRLAITKHRPSLPHQAGKALVCIAPFLDAILPPVPVTGHGKTYIAKITSLVNPHIDPTRMAQILIAIVRENHDRAA